MTDHVDRFYAALLVLAGHGHIKQRLIKAYEDHLADIHEDDLPISLKQPFADLRHDMHRESPLNGEGPICASVRKMSVYEAGDCAGRIVTLFKELTGQRDEVQVTLPLGDGDEVRVPPFLVKSV
jgi:hypothetical protein